MRIGGLFIQLLVSLSRIQPGAHCWACCVDVLSAPRLCVANGHYRFLVFARHSFRRTRGLSEAGTTPGGYRKRRRRRSATGPLRFSVCDKRRYLDLCGPNFLRSAKAFRKYVPGCSAFKVFLSSSKHSGCISDSDRGPDDEEVRRVSPAIHSGNRAWRIVDWLFRCRVRQF